MLHWTGRCIKCKGGGQKGVVWEQMSNLKLKLLTSESVKLNSGRGWHLVMLSTNSAHFCSTLTQIENLNFHHVSPDTPQKKYFPINASLKFFSGNFWANFLINSLFWMHSGRIQKRKKNKGRNLEAEKIHQLITMEKLVLEVWLMEVSFFGFFSYPSLFCAIHLQSTVAAWYINKANQ